VQSTSHISPWIAAFSKNVDNPGTASEPKRSFGGFHSTCLLVLSRRLRDGSVVSSLHCMNDPQLEGHMASIRRRKFLATHGGAAAAWPLVGAQEPPMPVVNGRASSDDKPCMVVSW
jgi:hypothetical protein